MVIKKHEQSFHGGVKYSRDRCSLEATHSETLRKHKKSVHKDMSINVTKMLVENGGMNDTVYS